MARLARVVVPGMPHHVTQRGNRRQETFFDDADYRAYLELQKLAEIFRYAFHQYVRTRLGATNF